MNWQVWIWTVLLWTYEENRSEMPNNKINVLIKIKQRRLHFASNIVRRKSDECWEVPMVQMLFCYWKRNSKERKRTERQGLMEGMLHWKQKNKFHEVKHWQRTDRHKERRHNNISNTRWHLKRCLHYHTCTAYMYAVHVW